MQITLTQADGRILLAAFWSLLKECEAAAVHLSDLRAQVESGFLLWNRLTGQQLQPVWAVCAPAQRTQHRLLGGCPSCGSQACLARSCQNPVDYLPFFNAKNQT